MNSPIVKLSAAAFLISLSASGQCKDLLALAATNLTAARSSPTIGSVKCPANLDSLVGMAAEVVVSKLGRPDLIEVGRGEHGQILSVQKYIFANSSATWTDIGVSVGGWSVVAPVGKPFTVMYFFYNKGSQIELVRCNEG